MIEDQLVQVEQRRLALKRKSGCRFVEPAEFCTLLVSNRYLIRSDDARAEVRGLLDPATDEWFLAEEEKLFLHHVALDAVISPAIRAPRRSRERRPVAQDL